jgi:sugar phosphate isomerase/epimerase
VNRIALQESTAPGVAPHTLVDIAHRAGFDSIGLKVTHSAGADAWWHKGAGSAELVSVVEHLLANRVSVLDVGRVELGGPPNDDSYRKVLDLASRLGARYVTASPVPTADELSPPADEFARLVQDCDDYLLVPLLLPAPGSSVPTDQQALEIVRRVGGAVIVTATTDRSAFEIESQVLEAGNRLGYVRLLADQLDGTSEEQSAGLLATVPVHVPIAVGLAGPGDRHDLEARAHRWSVLVDRMLEHPLARDRRLSLGLDGPLA